MNRLLTLYLDGNVDEKIYSERYNSLNKEIITLNIELSIEIPSKQKIQDYLLHLKNQFNESSNFEILKQIITTFVQKIIVYRETIEIELNLLSFLEQNITPTSTNTPCSLTIIKNRYSHE